MECKKMSTLAPDGKTSIVNLKDCLTVQNPPETRYLIYAWKGRLRLEGEKRRKVFLVSMCSRSDLLSARAEDLVLLGPGHLPKK